MNFFDKRGENLAFWREEMGREVKFARTRRKILVHCKIVRHNFRTQNTRNALNVVA